MIKTYYCFKCDEPREHDAVLHGCFYFLVCLTCGKSQFIEEEFVKGGKNEKLPRDRPGMVRRVP